MDVQSHVGVGDADVRTCSLLFTELVDDGILHLVGDELGVAEFFGEYHRVDSKRLVNIQVFCPVNILDAFIDVIGRQCLEMLDGFQNADSGMQLEVGAIHHLLVSSKRNHTSSFYHVFCTQLRQFFRQDRLEAHKGLGDEFKFLCHDVSIYNMWCKVTNNS